jgi:hypothetical protein
MTTSTITVMRPIPRLPDGRVRSGWVRQTHCRILAGCYETAGPPAREVYVPEQTGVVEGIGGGEWDGRTQLTAKMYVRVRLA